MTVVRGHYLLKNFLLFAVLLIIVSFFAWPHIMPSDTPHARAVAAKKLNVVIKPKIKSIDKNGRPYGIEADAAQREGSGEETYLVNPKGELESAEGRIFNAVSKTGNLSEDGKSLKLKGDVAIETSDGYTLDSQFMDVDLETKTATTTTHVQGTSEQGTINADEGMDMDQEGVVTFKGKTHLVMNIEE